MIKNIIFDFGDIFINLDKPAIEREFSKLGITKFTKDIEEILYQYEIGKITTQEFISFFFENYGISKTETQKAWNAILKDFPQQRLDFLKELVASEKYQLFLLSNTNEMHISYVQQSLGIDFYNEFKNCFTQFYLSHEIHLRKPNAAIYEFVLQKNSLVAQETLFVDDLKENTNAAKALDIHIWNLNPINDDVVELFNKNIVLH